MEYKDYYKILGVSRDADEKQIKRAYRRLAREYHPDKNQGNKAAEEKFKEINEAYEVLGNPDNRAKYDRLGRNYHRFQQMGGNPADFDFSQWFGAAGSGRQQRVNVDMGDLFGGSGGGMSDFFEALFGNDVFSRSGGQRAPRGYDDRANFDIEQPVEITLEEAFHGTSRTFGENGSQFTAKIPAGANTGTRIRLRGKGKRRPHGAGDLFLVVKVKPHPTFTRSGNDLSVKVDVDAVTAVLGGKVIVPTLDGPVSLTIPAGTQGSQTFRLKGKGMPHLRNASRRGDLLATVRIRIPTQLMAEERELYQKLADLKKRPVP
ncbi:MAG: DnaJ C-terminal domain-containing protein [Anaerolineae bacterium]